MQVAGDSVISNIFPIGNGEWEMMDEPCSADPLLAMARELA
jgi:hypothetical protein